MNKDKRLNFCKKQAALWIVRGHGLRRAEYNSRCRDIIASTDGITNADPTSQQGDMLLALQNTKAYKYILAVEDAADGIGRDMPDGMRVRLRRAVLLNCESGKEYPYEYLNCDFVSRRDFYRRKERFLSDVFDAL